MDSLNAIHKKLGKPSDKFKSIHIAGTNGKGTVAVNIARALESAGFTVGLFISPHLICINERISVNQKLISDEKMLEIYEKNKTHLKDLLFFDLLTFISFMYFSELRVDYAIIEAGIGGLEDSTNIISPCLSVITNISYDHCEFLGESLNSIARHKAGIIKENTPVVLGFNAKCDVCFSVAKQKKSKVIQIKSSDEARASEDFILENKLIADAALLEIGVKPLKNICSLPVRFEKQGKIIFDMAHNEAAFLALGKKIQRLYKGKKVIAVWNMCNLKEVEACLKILKTYVQKVYFFPFPSERLITSKKAKELGLEEYKTQKADLILVCGSIYYMDEAKKRLLSL